MSPAHCKLITLIVLLVSSASQAGLCIIEDEKTFDYWADPDAVVVVTIVGERPPVLLDLGGKPTTSLNHKLLENLQTPYIAKVDRVLLGQHAPGDSILIYSHPVKFWSPIRGDWWRLNLSNRVQIDLDEHFLAVLHRTADGYMLRFCPLNRIPVLEDGSAPAIVAIRKWAVQQLSPEFNALALDGEFVDLTLARLDELLADAGLAPKDR